MMMNGQTDTMSFSFQCCDHFESSVRKASVFCLVAIHNIVGEETLAPHLAELSGTKVLLFTISLIDHSIYWD